MKALRGLPLLALLMILLGTVVVLTPAIEAQTIYVLLIIDDAHPLNAEQHNASKDKMERLIRYIQSESDIPFKLSELKSNVDAGNPERMSRENILKWTQVVNADRDDVVFVYFSGHGGADRETRELYLSLPGGDKFERKVLADAVERIPCRLKILLTDACSFGVPITIPYFNTVKTAYVNLFLEHAGFLNVAGAVEGEYALGDLRGGIFTRAFVDILMGVGNFGDDGFVSWEEVFEGTKKNMHSYFQQFLDSEYMPQHMRDALTEIGQQSQRPKYFGEFPKRFRR